MRVSLRPVNNVVAVAVLTAMAGGLVGCSQSYDTTSVEASGGADRQAAPTTAVIMETIPPSTVPQLQPLATAPSDLQSTLTQLVSGFAENPDLVNAVNALNDGDMASIASMFDIDLGALSSLGLSVGDIGSLGNSVMASLAESVGDVGDSGLLTLLGELNSGSGAAAEASLDPMTLVGLLAKSVNVDIDVTRIAQSAIPQVIGALLSAVQGAQLIVTPEFVIQLDGVLHNIDPNGFNNFQVTIDNAPFIALVTSVILANNPVLQQGITENPFLDPELRSLLKQLEQLNAQLGSNTSASIYETLFKLLFPGG